MRRNNNVYAISVIGLMIAIQFLFGFTPIGTIPTPAFTITLMAVPVAIIACVFGPLMGALSGGVWGAIALIQAFTGMDATGTFLLNADIPGAQKYIGLVLMAFVARVLVGFLAGVIYDAMRLADKKNGFWSCLVACISASILNTVLFMSLFVIFFWQTPAVQSYCASANLSTDNALLFVFGFVGINFFVEIGVNAFVAAPASFGVTKAAQKLDVVSPLPRFFQHKEEKPELKAAEANQDGTN